MSLSWEWEVQYLVWNLTGCIVFVGMALLYIIPYDCTFMTVGMFVWTIAGGLVSTDLLN